MRNKPIRIYLEIPVKIITPMIGTNRTDSIFYDGKDIAKVIVGNHEYVLTTAGEYKFTYKGNLYNSSVTYKKVWNNLVNELTNTKIRKMNDNGEIENWGWFGINIWRDGKILDYPTDVYYDYEEAIEHFKQCVKNDILKGV